LPGLEAASFEGLEAPGAVPSLYLYTNK